MDILHAGVSGMMARFFCHPLDTMKTVVFTGFCGESNLAGVSPTNSVTSSFSNSVRAIWRREGVAGFYRGVGVATFGSAPGVALYLTTYKWTSSFIEKQREANYIILTTLPLWPFHLLCGFIAEAVSCVFWVPVDVTKERLQSQPPSLLGRYRGSYHALRTIGKYEGIRGLYKGYWSTLAAFGPYSGVYFAFYEVFTGVFSEYLLLGNFASALCAGGLANIVASIMTNPLEFIKTRLQVQRTVLSVNGIPTIVGYNYRYRGIIDGLCTVARDEGYRALWRGVGNRIAYAAPNAALTMAFYNYLQSR